MQKIQAFLRKRFHMPKQPLEHCWLIKFAVSPRTRRDSAELISLFGFKEVHDDVLMTTSMFDKSFSAPDLRGCIYFHDEVYAKEVLTFLRAVLPSKTHVTIS